MSERKHSYLFSAVVIALALVAAACGGGSDGDTATGDTTASPGSPAAASGAATDPLAAQPLAKKTSVTVVLSTFIEPYLAPLLAQELGEFAKENLEVSFKLAPASDGLTMLASGQANIQISAFRAGTFNAVDSGLPVAWVAHVYNGDTSQQGLWVRNEFLLPNGKVDPAKIKGMRVTLGPSSNLDAASMYYFYKWLEENDATLDDVEFVTLGSASDMLVAIEQGAIDAAGLLTPFWVDAQDIAKPVAGVGFQSSAYLINTEWADANPEVAEAFFRAVARTIDQNLTGDYKSDPQLVATIAKIMQVEPAVVAGSPSLIYDPTLPLDVEVAEELQNIWLEIGDIFDFTEPIPIDKIVDRSVIDNLFGR